MDRTVGLVDTLALRDKVRLFDSVGQSDESNTKILGLLFRLFTCPVAAR
jgi:hypothetical protein